MASIWLARNISRTMTTRPRPKWIWNVFLAGLSVVILLVFGYIVYQILGEYICFETKQVYVSYDGSNVITTTNAYLVSNDEYIIFDGNNKILDADLCICMPIVNSIFVIPGPESIKSGWDVTKIVQFTNLISLTPMLLRLTDVEDEENPPNHKISVSYEVIEKKK